MKQTEGTAALVLPAYSYPVRIWFFFIATLILVSCSTRNNENQVVELTEENVSLKDKQSSPQENIQIKETDSFFNPGESEKEMVIDWLREAEDAWFIKKDSEYTEFCLDQLDKSLVKEESEKVLYRLLSRKVYTHALSWDMTLLDHRNISRLYLDNDDLWIGTWSGGIGRFSIPLDEMLLLREERESLLVETIYSFLKQGHLIHMAGYGPIYEYDKRISRFSTNYPQGPDRINDLELYDNKLFASTVNKGIWIDQGNGSWQKFNALGSSALINTLLSDNRGELLIGTADKGILVYDGSRLKNLKSLYPDFKGTNITSLSEMGDYLLVGTYGEGGYLIDRQTGKTEFFSESNGTLSSDYVLCTSMGKNYAYWGTLGGGITAYSFQKQGEISFIGLEEGLLSLDVASLVLYDGKIFTANLGQGLIVIKEKIIETKL